jgi:hypothetical protein
MQLDCVGRNACLSVEVVEEGDARHLCAAAHPNDGTGGRHLSPSNWLRPTRAGRQRSLGNHVRRSVFEDDVEVAVALGSNECDPSEHSEDTALEREPSARQGRRRSPRYEVVHGHRLCGKQHRSVLESLHVPPLNATRSDGRWPRLGRAREECKRRRGRDEQSNEDGSKYRPHLTLRHDKRCAKCTSRAAGDLNRPAPGRGAGTDLPRPTDSSGNRRFRVEASRDRRAGLVLDSDRACRLPRDRNGQRRIGTVSNR